MTIFSTQNRSLYPNHTDADNTLARTTPQLCKVDVPFSLSASFSPLNLMGKSSHSPSSPASPGNSTHSGVEYRSKAPGEYASIVSSTTTTSLQEAASPKLSRSQVDFCRVVTQGGKIGKTVRNKTYKKKNLQKSQYALKNMHDSSFFLK